MIMEEKKILSIIFPLFNESKRLKSSLRQIKKYYQNKSYLKEIIFVNDGSTDSSLEIIKKFKANFPIANFSIKIISYEFNKGKGHAVRSGVLNAIGKIILFLDLDLSTPPEMTERFLEKFQNNSLLTGNRESELSKLTKRQSFIREKMGFGFTKLTNLVLRMDCFDYTCGFKMFPADLGKKIFSQAKVNRWGFDAEIIFLAKKFGAKIIEIPVIWEHKVNSTVDLKKDIFYTFIELLKIRWFDLAGRYEGA